MRLLHEMSMQSYCRARMPNCGSTTPEGASARNEAVRAAKYLGRELWRQVSGYHLRSRVEIKTHCVNLLG